MRPNSLPVVRENGLLRGADGRPADFPVLVFAAGTVFEERGAAFFCDADAAFTAVFSVAFFLFLCAVLDDPVRAMVCLSLVYALFHAIFDVYVLQDPVAAACLYPRHRLLIRLPRADK